jgi:hypothetical protein
MPPVNPGDFKGSRLEVGLTVLDGPRTQYEIAVLQGKPSGSVRGILRRMVDDKLLKADSDPPTRGTLYEIHPDAREALIEAAEGFQTPGSLVEHQRLVAIRDGPGRMTAIRLLSSTALSGAVSWVARTNSADDLLVAMNPDAEGALVDGLVLALEEAGFEVREGLVAEIKSAREMRADNKKAVARSKGAA